MSFGSLSSHEERKNTVLAIIIALLMKFNLVIFLKFSYLYLLFVINFQSIAALSTSLSGCGLFSKHSLDDALARLPLTERRLGAGGGNTIGY